MSRVGKLPINVPSNVKVTINKQEVSVTGPLGTLSNVCNPEVSVSLENSNIWVKPIDNAGRSRAMWGLWRSVINNMVVGVTVGFAKKLEINGVGFRAASDDKILTLFLGFSHEIKYAIPTGIKIKCEKPTLLEVTGFDKVKVGQVASIIRKLRPPEPYKGKGIKYDNEKIYRKEGKKK
jgi:large subunit ribosomal protein L6